MLCTMPFYIERTVQITDCRECKREGHLKAFINLKVKDKVIKVILVKEK